MITLIKKVLKDNKRSLIGYGLGLLIYSLLMAAIYPTFVKSGFDIEGYIENFPEAFMKAFGINLEGGFSFTSYIGMEYLNLMWIIIVLFFIVYFAARIIASTVDDGTIELLLSRPISRIKVALSYIIVFILGVIILEGVTILGFWLPTFWEETLIIEWGNLINTMFMLLLFSLAIFGYSFFFSSLFSSKGKVIGFGAGLTLAFYVMNFVALYWESVAWLKHFTLFYYYRGADLLSGQSIILTDALVFLGVFLVFTLGGLWYFKQRDICVK
ncbi:MAG: ABC transporter permease subunit [Patescibacteria group bacterium]|nr:ABC transporter permease subunit [Patescibacteria group bacterium]